MPLGFILRDVKVGTESKEEAGGCSEASGNLNAQVKPIDGEDFLSLKCFHCGCHFRVHICHSGCQTTW